MVSRNYRRLKMSKTNEGAFYVAFEGIDGAGKTTQIKKLANLLMEQGFSVFVAKEPWEFDPGNSSEAVKKSAAQYTADRKLLLYRIEQLKPLFDFILVDRSFMSTMVYQSTRELTMEHILLDNHANLMPDLILFLDVDAREALKRDDTEDNLTKLRIYRQEYYRAARMLGKLVNNLDVRGLSVIDTQIEVYEAVMHCVTTKFLQTRGR